mgnify:CR=1 FL=1
MYVWRTDLNAGLIPAHAGKTAPTCAEVWPVPAHPRSRGENVTIRTICTRRTGSSPLTRGKHERFVHVQGDLRLIPAHAGKTSASPRRSSASTAHPRSRGENSFLYSRLGCRKGSSPLTRGKLILSLAVIVLVLAHPRSRGENRGRATRFMGDAGSSPLTRGKRDLLQGQVELVRLIPAHAGKTFERPVRS